MASSAAFLSAPRTGAYNASKAAIVSLSETLRIELLGHGIGVSVACPGYFPSNLLESMDEEEGKLKDRVKGLMARSEVSAADIAAGILDAVEKNRFWIHPHRQERRLWYLKRFSPELLFRVVGRAIRKSFGSPPNAG